MNNLQNNGWTIVTPVRKKSRYKKYTNQIVVIVPPGKSRRSLALTQAGFQKLGSPKTVMLATRFSNAGIYGDDGGYAISRPTEGNEDSLYYFYPTAWVIEQNLKSGVYTAHVQDGMIVFDMAQTPSQI